MSGALENASGGRPATTPLFRDQSPARDAPCRTAMQRVGVMAELPALLTEFGIDPGAFLDDAGLPADALASGDGLIAYEAMGDVLCAAQERTGCPTIGLQVGRRGSLASLGLMGEYMANAPDVGTALMDIAYHQQRVANGGVVYVLRVAEEVLFGYRVHASHVRAADQICDGAVALAYNIVRELCGLYPVEVQLAHRAGGDRQAFSRAFGVPIRFDAEQYAVVYPASILKRPVRGADPSRRAALRGQLDAYWAVEPPDIVEQLRRHLAVMVLEQDHSLKAVADALGLHPRVLNRRLSAQGTTFQRELAEARFTLAGQLLVHTRLSLTVISQTLGYADLSVFTRAFERWCGVAPSQWRIRACLSNHS